MIRRTRRILCALGVMVVAACTHSSAGVTGSAPSTDQKGDVVVSPRMTGSGRQFSIRSTGGRPSGIVEVPVDATGRADVFGIRFIGRFSDVTRRDITDYIADATFVPAKRNGIPERGVFKMTFR